MEVAFKLASHKLFPNKAVVEVYANGRFVCALYPHKRGIHVVSKFMRRIHRLPSRGTIGNRVVREILIELEEPSGR